MTVKPISTVFVFMPKAAVAKSETVLSGEDDVPQKFWTRFSARTSMKEVVMLRSSA